jgi:hypothetical protein
MTEMLSKLSDQDLIDMANLMEEPVKWELSYDPEENRQTELRRQAWKESERKRMEAYKETMRNRDGGKNGNS